MKSTPIYTKGVNKILKTPPSITQYNSTVPQIKASKMTIKLNLCKTVQTKTEHYNLHKR